MSYDDLFNSWVRSELHPEPRWVVVSATGPDEHGYVTYRARSGDRVAEVQLKGPAPGDEAFDDSYTMGCIALARKHAAQHPPKPTQSL